MLQEFLEVYKESETRAELYKKTSHIEGVYVPKFYTINTTTESPKRIFKNALKKIKNNISKIFHPTDSGPQ